MMVGLLLQGRDTPRTTPVFVRLPYRPLEDSPSLVASGVSLLYSCSPSPAHVPVGHSAFFENYTCFDMIPLSGKIVAFDTQLKVRTDSQSGTTESFFLAVVLASSIFACVCVCVCQYTFLYVAITPCLCLFPHCRLLVLVCI